MSRWTDADLARTNARIAASSIAVMAAVPEAPKPSKFGNEKTGAHASKAESKRAAELRFLEQRGLIRALREQVPFVLIPEQRDAAGKLLERECAYVADFVYLEPEKVADDLGNACTTWHEVVEDRKGFRTPVYRLKRKLMLHVHGVRVRET